MAIEMAVAVLTAVAAFIFVPCGYIFFKNPIEFESSADSMEIRTKTTSESTLFGVFCEYERNHPGTPMFLYGKNIDVIEFAYTKRIFFNVLRSSSIFLGVIIFATMFYRFSEISQDPKFNDLFVDKSGGDTYMPASVVCFAMSFCIYYGTIILSYTQKKRLENTCRKLSGQLTEMPIAQVTSNEK